MITNEGKLSVGLHDIGAIEAPGGSIEMTYQCALEICTAILLAADATDSPVK
jgi:hypothetical protein